MRGKIICILLFVNIINHVKAQTVNINPNNIVQVKVIDGDTVLCANIRELDFYAPKRFKNKRHYYKYTRLVRNVKKVYPYSQIAKNKLEEVNSIMLTLDNEAERKKYMKQVEIDLKDEFEGELRKLTITQGRILIKLIDRETGNTSYELVKELRGSFSAIFWQTLARVFGSNLKTEFDAEGEDKLINEIVIMIENGQL